MESMYPLWMEILNAAVEKEWLGYDIDEGYRFASRTLDGFEAMVPATVLRDLLASQEIPTWKSVHLVLIDPKHEPYLYHDPGIKVMVVLDQGRVLGPLDANGVRREVRVADE